MTSVERTPWGAKRPKEVVMENSFSHESCMCWAQILRMILETHGQSADHRMIARQLGRTLKNGIFLENVKTYLRMAGLVTVEREDQTWEEIKLWQQIAQDYGGHVAVEIWDKRDYQEVIERLRVMGYELKPTEPDEHALLIKAFGKDSEGEFVETYDPGYERVYTFWKEEWMGMWFKMKDEAKPRPYLNEETGENVTRGWLMVIVPYSEAPKARELEQQGILAEAEKYLRSIGQPITD